ncbi:BapA prefix-like domain-containing protein [Cronobacter turicensis]|uniref:BapA prefix-like domain-containing protein n=1 Tax=Cronobacter turicensis TaxID=413502 RepID=UPI001FB6634E|nr:BapA prefix-like domain-containing protein [Cronobacter turicensis]
MAVQNSLSPTADILNQDTGNVITHYSQNADRVVNLSQTSIVRINASSETVNFYERQGNDLIVHMKDGTTVRYQNFSILMRKASTANSSLKMTRACIMRCLRSPLNPARRSPRRWLTHRSARSPAQKG